MTLKAHKKTDIEYEKKRVTCNNKQTQKIIKHIHEACGSIKESETVTNDVSQFTFRKSDTIAFQ